MLSIYFATGIFCGIGILINFFKRKKGILLYSKQECLILYAITRFIPVAMHQQYTMDIALCLLADAAIFAVLYFVLYGQKACGRVGNVGMLFVLNPVVILCMLSGQFWRMLIVAAAFVLAVLIIKRLKKSISGFSSAEFYPEYIGVTASLFFLVIAVDYFKQSLAQCFASEGNVPVLLILSVAVFAISEICACHKVLNWEKVRRRFASVSYHDVCGGPVEASGSMPGFCTETGAGAVRPGKKTVLAILLITAVYGSLVFLNLGSFEAPETGKKLTQGNGKNEIVLDFGKNVYISKIDIYLGYESKRTFSLSYPLDGKWKVFKSKENVESVFDWNPIDINGNMSTLGMVSLDSEAYINEIVVVGKDGKKIRPVNASKYAELFDEQELYPKNNTYYYGTMFDEVYHARTAYEFNHDLPIYETTHPPLGKSLIGIGISLFGMNPFGWRFVCALFGILMIPVVCMFAWRMTRRSLFTVAAGVLMGTAFMNFTLSRIATLDIIVGSFILMMFYFMYCFIDDCKRGRALKHQICSLILCGGATAGAVASKWTGIYAAAGIAVILAVFLISYFGKQQPSAERRHSLWILFFTCVGAFIVLPCIVYVLSYIPFTQVYKDTGLIQTVIANAKQMLSYHEGTVFEHPYSSEWYEWLIDRQPLLDALQSVSENKVSSVATFGNPLIMCGGLAALVHNAWLWQCKNNSTGGFLCLAYASMLVPWLLIHRTVFIYQYFVCLLILILMICNSLYNLKHNGRRWTLIVTGASLVLFVLYYPVLSGYPVSVKFVDQVLELFTTWRFA